MNSLTAKMAPMAFIPETEERRIPISFASSIAYGLGLMTLLGWLTGGEAPTWALIAATCLSGSAVAGVMLSRLWYRRHHS